WHIPPSEAAAKWRNNATNGVTAYKQGVRNVNESPMQKAIDQQDVFKMRLLEAIDNGKWKDGLASVSLDEWKDRTENVGGNRFASGVAASEGKVESFMAELLPYQQNYLKNLPKRGSRADNKARMDANFEEMSKFRYKRRRG
ncbi:MAG: hypothetical protein MJA83_12265, partial [Gammaproteobacteria bacterium]|nr:hypothetical protein [Gammaproteobacteria bacterium]